MEERERRSKRKMDNQLPGKNEHHLLTPTLSPIHPRASTRLHATVGVVGAADQLIVRFLLILPTPPIPHGPPIIFLKLAIVGVGVGGDADIPSIVVVSVSVDGVAGGFISTPAGLPLPLLLRLLPGFSGVAVARSGSDDCECVGDGGKIISVLDVIRRCCCGL